MDANPVGSRSGDPIAHTSKWVSSSSRIALLRLLQTDRQSAQAPERCGGPIALLQRCDTQQSGCTPVLSEDMSDGETYGTVTVRNPFAVIRS
jgi:predicted nucleic acid-binding protein